MAAVFALFGFVVGWVGIVHLMSVRRYLGGADLEPGELIVGASLNSEHHRIQRDLADRRTPC